MFVMKVLFFLFLCFITVFSACNFEKSRREPNEFDDYIQHIRETRRAFRKAMNKKDIKLTRNGPCDDALGDTLHERSKVYIETVEISNNIVVTFRFIEACCLEFLADYKIHGDTMLIKLGLVNEEVCLSLCWYRYRFETKNDYKDIKHIVIKDID